MPILQTIQDFFCCVNRATFPTPYDFQFNGFDKTIQNVELFESNFVKTSKYTWYNFLFLALLIQFKRLANVYFLIIAILQTITIISPLNPVTAWAPLIVVLSISILRQGYEDFQRYKSDKQMNYQTITHIRRNGVFQQLNWSNVVIGDICCIYQEELFPADMILLCGANEGGIAFIETASLDGQKNLKPRAAFKQTIKYQRQENLSKLRGDFFGIPPDKQLHKFSSKMLIDGHTTVIQGDKQLLYRGSRLKNTKWVYGLVIYTGKNTKIMMNSDSSSTKMSQIERKVNYILVLILCVQIICCFIEAILYGIFRGLKQQTSQYIQWSPYSIAADSVLIFLSYFVLINTMIPISLVVSIEVVKVAQSLFINSDNLMYSQFRKKNVQVKSASLNEELGQIQYVFSDKTGTLTMNLMQFKIAVIGNKLFGDLALLTHDHQNQQKQKGFKDQKLTNLIKTGAGNQQVNPKITIKNGNGGQQIHLSTLKDVAQQYLMALGLAHQVVSQTDKNGKSFYQGPSPDQITLVDAAKAMDFQFIRATQSSTCIKIKGVQKTFDLLQVFPFTSDRKRMSIIIKSNNTIKLYTKGADSIIKSRLAKDQSLNLDNQLNSFAKIGLRTLLIGMRVISDQQYNLYKKATEQLPSSNRESALNQLISQLQTNIYLIGATAVLDRLQDEVPQTIRDLIRANIKVWMLTGDKMQTAQNIAKSCNLIQPNFEVLKYTPPKNSQHICDQLKKLVTRVQQLNEQFKPKAFLIQGSDLTPILASQQCKIQLANLAKSCQAVICCRLLPIQKAQVVLVVRQKLNKITLSIGDGANDVPMIKAAHLGIGLFGQEGMGAVQASDYALPQFRMLWRLLLIHGRWNYIRISQMILYFFYKNMLFTVPHLVIAFYCGFSAQTIYDDNYIALYNLIFTSVPLVVRAVLEQDVNYVSQSKKNNLIGQQTVLQLNKAKVKQSEAIASKFLPQNYKVNRYFFRLFPKLYFVGQQNCIFNYTNYITWVIEGFCQAIMIALFCIYIFSNPSLNQNGYNSDFWLTGLTIFSCIIIIVTFKLATHTKFWSIILIISIIFISIGLYLAYMWISNYFFTENILGTTFIAWTTVQTYLVVLFICCFLLTIDGVILYIDFDKGGYASKMRQVILEQKQVTRTILDEKSLKYSQNLSAL